MLVTILVIVGAVIMLNFTVKRDLHFEEEVFINKALMNLGKFLGTNLRRLMCGLQILNPLSQEENLN